MKRCFLVTVCFLFFTAFTGAHANSHTRNPVDLNTIGFWFLTVDDDPSIRGCMRFREAQGHLRRTAEFQEIRNGMKVGTKWLGNFALTEDRLALRVYDIAAAEDREDFWRVIHVEYFPGPDQWRGTWVEQDWIFGTEVKKVHFSKKVTLQRNRNCKLWLD